MCGRKLDDFDKMCDFSISGEIGYGSRYDGDYLDLHLCCECMDELIRRCSNSPIRKIEYSGGGAV